MLCLANQFAHKAVGIEDLSVVEYSLHRRLVRTHKEVYLLLMVCESRFNLQEALLFRLSMGIETSIKTLLHL